MTSTIHYVPPLPCLYHQPTFPISTLKMEKIQSSTTCTTILQKTHYIPQDSKSSRCKKLHSFPHVPFPGYLASLSVPPLTNYIPDHVLCMPLQHIPKLHHFFYTLPSNSWLASRKLSAYSTHGPAHSTPPLLSLL